MSGFKPVDIWTKLDRNPLTRLIKPPMPAHYVPIILFNRWISKWVRFLSDLNHPFKLLIGAPGESTLHFLMQPIPWRMFALDFREPPIKSRHFHFWPPSPRPSASRSLLIFCGTRIFRTAVWIGLLRLNFINLF